MAIKYPYLGDGSPFNAESLNVRFDSLMGPASGVNAIGSPEVSRGAFRHNHLPSLVGHAGRDMASIENGFSSGTNGVFYRGEPPTSGTFLDTETITDWHQDSHLGFPQDVIYTHNLPTDAYSFVLQNFDAVDNVDRIGAFIVLANIHVLQFKPKEQSPLTFPYEKLMGLELGLALKCLLGPTEEITIVLDESVRSVSPRVTIGPTAGFGAAGITPHDGPGEDDIYTYQDVALRCVVGHIPNITDVTGVEIRGTINGQYADQVEVLVDKVNVTIIPLHAKLLEY